MNVSRVISSLRNYLKALNNIGGFSALFGLIIWFIDDVIGSIAGFNFNIPPYIYALWFVVSFLISNVIVFYRYVHVEPEFHIRETSLSLKRWAHWDNGCLVSISNTGEIIAKITLDVNNNESKNPKRIEFFIDSFQSSLLPYKTEHNKHLELEVNPLATPDHPSDNPFTIQPHTYFQDLLIQFEFCFKSDINEDAHLIIAKLHEFNVSLGISIDGSYKSTRQIAFDVNELKTTLENELISNLPTEHYECMNTGIVLNDYYQARLDAEELNKSRPK